jgi:hypothetical protein
VKSLVYRLPWKIIFLSILGKLTRERVIVATALRVSYEECSMVVLWQQQLLLCLDTFYLAKVPSATVKTMFINQHVINFGEH